MIDKATVDRIYSAADIVEVIGDFVTLKKKGVNYQALRPFHNEKTPRSSCRRRKDCSSVSAAARAATPSRS